jgi:hypothetical protein
LIIIEASRARFWRRLPTVDYTDTKTMIIAASAGKDGIALEVERKHNGSGIRWNGDAADKIVDGIRVQLVGNLTTCKNKSPVLQVAQQRAYIVSNTELNELLIPED